MNEVEIFRLGSAKGESAVFLAESAIGDEDVSCLPFSQPDLFDVNNEALWD
jgi:hypothetical protein